jgi:hypothetical protein
MMGSFLPPHEDIPKIRTETINALDKYFIFSSVYPTG